MAIGRIISKKICLNKIVNEKLSSDTCRLAFTWTISHLDRDGRIHGDPGVLRSTIFPRRKDINDEMVEGFIREWAKNRLVIWYEADGDKWLQFPKFRVNQPKLRYDREAPSSIPPPEEGKAIKIQEIYGKQSGSQSGKEPDNIPPKGREEKGSEFKRREENLSNKSKKPEQAPFLKNPPDDNGPPSEDNGTKSKDQQLTELAVRLKTEDPRGYKKLLQQYPELEDEKYVPSWPP